MEHAALDHLRRCDRRLGVLVDRVGPYRPRRHTCSPCESVARAIVYQQLSGKAAATILGRLRERCGGAISPAALAALGDQEIRDVGISGQKLSYLRDLQARLAAGALDLRRLARRPDEEVIEALTAVRGIGRWSAEMYLMFRLGRPDVLPVGDLGIQKAVRKGWRLRSLPDPEKLRRIAEPWRPWRSVACWYLWRSLDAEAAID